MDHAIIRKGLRDFVMRRFNVPADDTAFTDGVNLFDYGYVDSFGAVDLIAFVEEHFSVKIGQSDLITFPLNSIDEIADFAVKRRKGEL